jgi:glutamyl-tRNA synthetase
MAANSRYFFVAHIELDEKAARKHLNAESAGVLGQLRTRLQALADWSAPAIHAELAAAANELGLGLGKIAQPLRVAVSGGAVSPPIDATMALIGRERALERLALALAWIERSGSA